MKAVIIVLALFASAFALVKPHMPRIVNPVYHEWEMWKQQYQPHYETNDEEQKRFKVFVENKALIKKLNKAYESDPDGARFGLNQFADLSPEEFAAQYLHEIPANYPRPAFLPPTTKTVNDYPKEKNWVNDGAVTPVKNQGQCGSCWSFSVTGNMEGVYKVAHGELPVLSEQQLVDCDHDCMEYKGQKVCDSGCDGGLMPNAMAYAVREGMTTEDKYKYKAKAGKCEYTSSQALYHFSAWRAVNGTDNDMVAALNDIGPLSVGVDATLWQFYVGGIFSVVCGKQLNHGVLLVGYGVQGKKEYWIIKNSWGASWGEKGYLRLIREKDKCGVDNFVNTIIA